MGEQRTPRELKDLLHDSRKVLRLGELREGQAWMDEALKMHELTANDVRAVMNHAISQSTDEEDFFQRAVDDITTMTGGDVALAETFVILDSLDCLADRIFENIDAQAEMQRQGIHSGHAANLLDQQLKEMRKNLVEAIANHSGSSPFIVSTVVDGYIGNLREQLGAKPPGPQL